MGHVSDKFVKKIETYIFVYSDFRNSCLLLDDVEKHCTAR